MSWVRVPPEAADFLRKMSSSGVVELCYVSLCIFGRCLEVCLSCIYTVYKVQVHVHALDSLDTMYYTHLSSIYESTVDE